MKKQEKLESMLKKKKDGGQSLRPESPGGGRRKSLPTRRVGPGGRRLPGRTEVIVV